MRQDMYQVIVERPRRGGYFRSEIPAPNDLEDSPRQEGLRKRHRSRKWLNENLAPLKRYLAAQVGRPWDKVYSEICAGVDRRNTAQQHIHQHIGNFVAIRVHRIDSTLYYDRGWRGLTPLANTWSPEFFVDPTHGPLCLNKAKIHAQRTHREERKEQARAYREQVRDDRRIIDANTQLHRIDGIWYRVELAPIEGSENALDAVRNTRIKYCPRCGGDKRHDNHTLFGDRKVYACSKRQLNKRELQHYRIVNDEA
jgi:hypothetical protein